TPPCIHSTDAPGVCRSKRKSTSRTATTRVADGSCAPLEVYATVAANRCPFDRVHLALQTGKGGSGLTITFIEQYGRPEHHQAHRRLHNIVAMFLVLLS